MIAHRLSTIQSADHILFIKSPKEMIDAPKGSLAYDQIIATLRDNQVKKARYLDEESSQITEENELEPMNILDPQADDEENGIDFE